MQLIDANRPCKVDTNNDAHVLYLYPNQSFVNVNALPIVKMQALTTNKYKFFKSTSFTFKYKSDLLTHETCIYLPKVDYLTSNTQFRIMPHNHDHLKV